MRENYEKINKNEKGLILEKLVYLKLIAVMYIIKTTALTFIYRFWI